MRYLSLFSGMEAAGLAWSPLGWECAAVAEIEPAACALLRHRLPNVPNLGDVTAITDAEIEKLGRIDVVIGGSPCQDLSVAGKRAGLAGARSGLFHEQLRIFNAARTLCGARWLVWENVPGAFSSNKGRDFAVVVGAMAGCRIDVPADGWGNEGVALGENGLVEWSVLDAQWFGVAQRRRRVFAVLDTGEWSCRPPVLLEPDSLRGDSAPCREAREGAPCATGGGPDGGRISGAVTSKWAKGSGGPAGDECYNMVAHTLRADGFDASEDGTGRGTPLIPAFAIQAGALRQNPLSGPDGVGVQEEHAYTLEARAEVQCVAFAQNQRDEVRQMAVAGALAAESGMKQQTYLQQGMAVRRLTPRECERLQGAQDDWTLVPNAKGKPMADGPRYKMLGNSFAVPVIRWIGWQIQAAHGAGQQMREACDECKAAA